MNTLPKSFGVFNDGSQLFIDTVMPYLKINGNWAVNQSEGCIFGITKNGYVTISDCEDDFEIILTLEQFIEMTKEKQIVYGIKQTFIMGQSTIMKPLFFDKQSAINALHNTIEDENNQRFGQPWNVLTKCVTAENTFLSSSDLFTIEEFEVI